MAKFCTNCGKEISDGIAFCTECGVPAPKEDAATQQPAKEPVMAAAQPVKEAAAQPQQTYQQPVYQQPPQQTYQQQAYTQTAAPPQDVRPKGGKYGVVSTGTYFGLMFLFAIPIIGWLACIIMTFAPKNENIKHFAKAMLIWLIIGIVLSVAMYFVFRWLSGSIMDYINQMTDGAFGDWKDIFEQFNQFKDGDFSSIPSIPTN